MPFSIGFAAGVTPTKWTRIWSERRPDVPLEVFRTDAGEQTAVLHDSRADVSIVRLPVDEAGLSLISLYREIPVVVAAKDHAIADVDSVSVADLADEHLLQDPDDVPEWRAVATELREGTRIPLPAMRGLDEAMEQVAAGVGILVLPHSLARLHGRKDVVSRPVEDVAETEVALAWLTAHTTDEVQEFIGIVRGRTAASSRATSAPAADTTAKKPKKTDKAKAAAKAARAEAQKAKPAQAKKTPGGPGRTRSTAILKKGKRRGRG